MQNDQLHRASEDSSYCGGRGVAAGRCASRLRLAVGSVALTLLWANSAFADVENPLLPRDLSPMGMFLNASNVVKAVMIGLAFASFLTWTIWLAKSIELWKAVALARQRLAFLESGVSLRDALHECWGKRDAVAQLVQTAGREAELSGRIVDDSFKERVALRLERAEAAAARQISRGANLLATIGATAPFVGLFGTVWGIMNAFIGISQAHTTNLSVVAPGIAEALLTTAMGLFAAIPAVVIYNFLAREISGYRALLSDASAQLLLMISRHGTRASDLSQARAAE